MSNIESSQWSANDAESSDDAKDQKKKADKAKSTNDLWAKLAIARSGGLLDAPNEQKRFIEEENEDDEEDSEDEKPKTKTLAEAAGKVSEQPPEEVFETMTPPKGAELADIPHVDYDKPTIPLTAEENKVFTEMASGAEMPQELDDLKVEHTPPVPSWDMATVPEPFRLREEVSPEPTPATDSTTPFWRPSPSPSPMSTPLESSPSEPFGSGPELMGSASPSSTSEISSGVTAVVETLKAAAGLTEMVSNPKKLIARVLTQAALDGYLNRYKRGAGGSGEQIIRQQNEQISELQDRQRQANERLAALFQEQAQQAEQPQEILDQNGNRIALKRGQHYEVAAGGFSAVVDEHGRAVRDAFTQGEAFQQEQHREQVSDDAFAKLSGPGGASGAFQDSSGLGGLGAPFPPLTGQPQIGSQSQYSFSGQPDEINFNHRLPEPHSNRKNVAIGPWVLTAVAILIIVYFLAALA